MQVLAATRRLAVALELITKSMAKAEFKVMLEALAVLGQGL